MSEPSEGPRASGGRRRWRLAAVIAVLAALIPVVPIVIGVTISSAKPGAAKATANSFKPTPPAPSSAPQTTTTPAARTRRRAPVAHAIQGWNGGNRIAIHFTPETSSIGLPVSHGCLGLTLAEGRWLMAHIPVGTPTLISA